MSSGQQRQLVKKTPEQVMVLERGFLEDQYPSDEQKTALAAETGLTEHQVSIWFTHRRRKERRANEDQMQLDGMDQNNGIVEFDVESLDEETLARYSEMQEIIELAKGRLEFPYREDGPPLALYFDEIPEGNARAGQDIAQVGQNAVVQRALTAKQELEKLEASIKREQERLLKQKEKQDSKQEKARLREIARLEAERQRQLERALREQKREEERLKKQEARMRTLQLKEEKRLEAEMQRELKRKQKEFEKEEKKRSKEMMRALYRQEREALRTRTVYSHQKDDLDIEWDNLVSKYKEENGIPKDVPIVEGQCQDLVRPPFPPPDIEMLDLLPKESNQAIAGFLIASWDFLMSFHQVLAIDLVSVDEFVQWVVDGSQQSKLHEIHINLIRLIQSDAEESRAIVPDNNNNNKPDENRGLPYFTGARLLEEAWAWGFDVDSWRAHLNRVTWTEICRQVCISAGLGKKRPVTKRKKASAGSGKPGEDLIVSADTGKLELQLPSRLSESSVKGACWMVLKDAGYEGLRVEEIAKRIQKMGLRDLRTSRTPETSVAGAMGRDILFERIAPATYALRSLRSRYKELAGLKDEDKEEVSDSGDECQDPTDMDEDFKVDVASNNNELVTKDEEEEEEEEETHNIVRDVDENQGEAWLSKLKHASYNDLTLEERVYLLNALCQIAMDGPTVRLVIHRRLDEQQRIRKTKADEDKVEQNVAKLRKKIEVAAKARQDAAESQIELEKMIAQKEGKIYDQNKSANLEKSKEELMLEKELLNAENALRSMSVDVVDISLEGLKKRASSRADLAFRELLLNSVRREPLGMDRQYNKYWRFYLDGSNDSDCAYRIYFEDARSGTIKCLANRDAFLGLLDSLGSEGPREKELRTSLVALKKEVIQHMPSTSWVSRIGPSDASSTPLANFDLAPCASKVIATESFDVPISTVRSSYDCIKESIVRICTALEHEQVKIIFDKVAFVKKVLGSSTLAEVKQLLGELEGSIEKDYIHNGFSVDPLLVKGAWISIGNEVATALPGSTVADVLLPQSQTKSNDVPTSSNVHNLPLSWLPETPSSISLRVMSLDASVRYRKDECGRETMAAFRASLRPCRLYGSSNGLVESMYLRENGHADPTLFACYPHRLRFGPRVDFSFPIEQFQNDVRTGSDAQVLPAVNIMVQAIGSGRGRGRGRRGGRRGSIGGRGGGRRPEGDIESGKKSVEAATALRDGSDMNSFKYESSRSSSSSSDEEQLY